MRAQLDQVVDAAGMLLDLVGVLVVAGGVLGSSVVVLRAGRQNITGAYEAYRRTVGRAILLGLEILVAADIIETVAVSPTFGTVGVLAAVVAVRTGLSLSLQVELDGRWPWRTALAGTTGYVGPQRGAA